MLQMEFCFLKEIEKNEVLSKIYCVKIRNQDDLTILCEKHLIELILAKVNTTVLQRKVEF